MKSNVLSRRKSMSLHGGVNVFRVRDPESVISWCELPEFRNEKKGPVLYLKGLCLIQKAHMEEALECFSEALRLGHDSVGLRIIRARCFYKHQDYPYDAVLAEADVVVERDPDNLQAHWIRVLSHYNQQRFAQAVAAMECMAGLNQALTCTDPEVKGLSADSQLGVNLFSIPNVDRLLQTVCNPWLGYFWIGQMFLVKSEYEKAMDYFGRALLADPKMAIHRASLHNNRAICFGRLGDCKNALQEIDKAIQLNPDGVREHFNRGLYYRRNWQLEDSISDFTWVVGEAPDLRQSALVERGVCHVLLGRPEEALRDLDWALQEVPDCSEALLCRAIIYIRKSNFHNALADLNKFLDLNPECATGYRLRGQLFMHLSQQDLIRGSAVDISQEDCFSHISEEPYYLALLKDLVGYVDGLAESTSPNKYKNRGF